MRIQQSAFKVVFDNGHEFIGIVAFDVDRLTSRQAVTLAWGKSSTYTELSAGELLEITSSGSFSLPVFTCSI